MTSHPPRFPWPPSSVALLGVIVLLAEWLGACQGSKPPRFVHETHLTGMACGAPGQPACMSCTTCHAVASRNEAQHMPGMGLCNRCHAADSMRARAALTRDPERVSGKITINHDSHLALDEIRGQCVPCHAGVVQASAPPLPPMSQCFTCHEHSQQWERGECTPCHDRTDLARTLPVTFLRHDEAFMRHHGDVTAQTREKQLCQSCHTQAQCQACHDVSQGSMVEWRAPDRIESRQVHRGDFMTRHAIEASASPARCLTCHEPQSCDSCHVARGISGNRMDAHNPHPLEWVGTNTASSNFHGAAARRDILSCASCHEAGPATNCIRCHKVGAFGGNPHPGGWRSARDPGDRMCRYCHE